jgi:hypothetical protein
LTPTPFVRRRTSLRSSSRRAAGAIRAECVPLSGT